MNSGFRQEAVDLALRFKCRDIAELGVWRGELSRMFAKIARRLVLVDPLIVEANRVQVSETEIYICKMGGPERTQVELDEFYQDIVRDISSAEFLRMSSLEAACLIEDRSLDMVYIDSVHTYEYCKQEILAWLSKLRIGGIMAGDDYVSGTGAVERAVDEIFGTKPRNRTWWEIIQ